MGEHNECTMPGSKEDAGRCTNSMLHAGIHVGDVADLFLSTFCTTAAVH